MPEGNLLERVLNSRGNLQQILKYKAHLRYKMTIAAPVAGPTSVKTYGKHSTRMKLLMGTMSDS